jgi:hypothetical protein
MEDSPQDGGNQVRDLPEVENTEPQAEVSPEAEKAEVAQEEVAAEPTSGFTVPHPADSEINIGDRPAVVAPRK